MKSAPAGRASAKSRQAKKPVKVTLSSGRTIVAYWQDKVFFDNQMLTVAEFLSRFVTAVRKIRKTPDGLRKSWADGKLRKELFETLDAAGFNADKLREIQRNTGRQECDILDVMLDVVYDIEPLTREFRAQMAETHMEKLTSERKSLLRVMLDNYVRDGVWTLTTESYNDLLKQRYGTLSGACGRLGFRTPQEALSFSDNMQKELYAS